MKQRKGLLGSLFALVLLGLCSLDASCQAIDWQAYGTDLPLQRNAGSSRLDAMGGLSITVPDEGAELNLNDYGRNLAGQLWDSDGRRTEFWVRSLERKHDVYDEEGRRNRFRDELLEVGGQMTWRSPGRRFLGLDYTLDQLNREVERDDNRRIQGPWWGGFVGQAIGRFTLGGAIHFTADNEDLQTESVFAIRHQSSGIRYTGALAYRRGPVVVGLQGEHQVNTIRGISRDESRFHEDDLTWIRPIRTYEATLLWSPSPRLKGAVRARSVRIDGRQEVEISWSDRMPENPDRENFRAEAGTFDEKIRAADLGTRWEVRPFGALIVAGEIEVGERETDVVEGTNFKGSRRAEQSEERLSRAVVGGSYALADERVRLGVEGALWSRFHKETHREGDVEVTSRQIVLRTGFEWFLTDLIAVRGGYIRFARDEDVDAPRTLGIGDGVTVGAGYHPRGGLVQIDASLRYLSLVPDYEGDPHLEESRLYFSLGARFLL